LLHKKPADSLLAVLEGRAHTKGHPTRAWSWAHHSIPLALGVEGRRSARVHLCVCVQWSRRMEALGQGVEVPAFQRTWIRKQAQACEKGRTRLWDVCRAFQVCKSNQKRVLEAVNT
jgi:hypothetical protein